MDNKRGLIISQESPFRKDIEAHQARVKPTYRTTTGTSYKQTRITVIESTEYFPGRYAKLYQNKELLGNLGPYECKLLIYIALNMDYESEQIHIPYQEVGMNRKTLSSAIMELVIRRVLAKVEGKKAWYWVNITLLIVGHISKHESDDNNNSDHTSRP